jgi:hypothetical protein
MVIVCCKYVLSVDKVCWKVGITVQWACSMTYRTPYKCNESFMSVCTRPELQLSIPVVELLDAQTLQISTPTNLMHYAVAIASPGPGP